MDAFADSKEDADLLTQQRDLKFKQWLKTKEIRDKALEYMSKLSVKRAEDDKDLLEVGIALLAADRILGNDDGDSQNKGPSNLMNEASLKAKVAEAGKKSSQKTMRSVWFKWTMEHHTFSNVQLTDQDMATFSAAVKEFMEKEEDERNPGKHNYSLPSLKFSYPAEPQPGKVHKPLSKDEKHQNVVFLRHAKRVWKDAKSELEERLVESIARAEVARLGGTDGGDSESKGGESKGSAPNRGAGSSAIGAMSDEKRGRLEYNALYDMSLRQLRDWVEMDEDKQAELERGRKLERQQEAKKSHEQFVKQKDSLRIRIPDGMVAPPAPAMTYGTVVAAVKPKAHATSLTTVEQMARSGLKYVHATGKGRQGFEGDLEKSRKKLIAMGLLNRENFDADEDSNFSLQQYKRELRTNPVLLEKKRGEEQAKKDAADAYESWTTQKELRETALKYLAHCPAPNAKLSAGQTATLAEAGAKEADAKEADAKEVDAKELHTGRSSLNTTGLGQTFSLAGDPAMYKQAIDVGKALKKVDRGLLQHWADWAAGCFSSYIATVIWDALEPKCCDVHNLHSSQLKDAFLKLLRPGLDYRRTFTDFAEKVMRRRELNEVVDDREQAMKDLAITKRQMGQLLKEMGIVMKPHELSAIIDAFDENGDGVITLQEFLNFVGPKRDKKGGSSLILNQKCSFLTTCQVTGMPNGYSISNPTRRALKSGVFAEPKKGALAASANDSKGSKNETRTEEVTMGNTDAKVIYKTLSNGEKRMLVELPERKRREELLRRLGLMEGNDADAKDEGAKKSAPESKSGGHDRDPYDDDDGFEDYHDDEDHRPLAPPNSRSDSAQLTGCPYNRWKLANRKEGLRFLATITKDNRAEALLKKMIADVQPPRPPNFYTADAVELATLDTGFDPCTELELRWNPNKGDLVSFFSLEFAGPDGGLLRSEKYQELCKDPPDASPNNKFSFRYRVRDLKPGVRYAFRIRGYNGTGPGDFVYKSFSTLTASPPAPRITRLAHDSVTLRWVFTEGFFKRIAELKKIFAQADADGNGTLSREEMSAALDDHNGNVSPELKSFLERAMTSNRVNPALGYGALFDIIEGDDDNKLSWSEFEQFFMTAGWTSVPGTTSRPLTASSGAMSTAESAANLKDIVYVVERCVSEFDAEYQEVVRTAAGEITVSRLDPGLSYRFRVYAINSSGKPGPKSDSVIVHTMIEIPPAPTCQGRNIGTRKVVLEWKGRTKAKSSRDKTVVEKMIGNWAGTQGQGETGVSVEAAFARYDKDKNGSIDLEEFALMLEDLGVDVTEERLGEAFAEFDADKNRRLSFDEFSRWWRRDEVTYIIKRSDAVGPLCKPAIYTGSQANSMRLSYGAPPSPSPSHFRNSLGGSGGRARSPGVARVSSTFSIADDRNTPGSRQRSSSVGRRSSSGANLLASSGLKDDPARRSKRARAVPMPIVSYRGNKTRCEIAGLEPNRLYHYRLRYSGSRSNSELSAPLVLMTAPLSITDRPLLVTLSATTVRVKWYPPEFGAFKFLVQLRVESRNSGLANVGIGTEVTADGWATVYNGSDTLWTGTTMTPDSEYSCRVLCVNSQGTASEPSPVLTFQTQKRAAAQALTPKTADLNFTIESTGDICVGDTILLTERLFAKHGAPATPRRGAAVSSGSVAGSRAGSRVGSPRKAAWGGLRPTLTESPARGVAGRAAGIRTSASKSGIKMDASIVSLVSGDGSVDGELLGERIIAAHVVKDNYRSLRDAVPYHNTDGRPPGMRPVKYTRRDCKKASKDRTLWLEVVWQKATTEACKPYELKPGVIGQRVQNALERFEVFRCAWSDESLRRPQWEDWSSMSECFIQVDTD